MSTLYFYLLAFNPQKVLLAIAETGFECRVQQVNLFNGESLRPWFMRINPNSTVPVLVVNEARGECTWLVSTLGGDCCVVPCRCPHWEFSFSSEIQCDTPPSEHSFLVGLSPPCGRGRQISCEKVPPPPWSRGGGRFAVRKCPAPRSRGGADWQ